MRTEKREDPLVEMGYEVRDIDIAKIKKAVLYFFGFVVFSAVFGYLALFGFGIRIFQFSFGAPGLDPGYIRGESGYAKDPKLPPPPYPLLQTNASAKTDLFVLRGQEDERLNGTGYADDARTRAHIPIERAIDLLAQRGLPKTAGAEAQTRGTTDDEMRVDTTESVDAARRRMDAAEAAARAKVGDAGLGTGSQPVDAGAGAATPREPAAGGAGVSTQRAKDPNR